MVTGDTQFSEYIEYVDAEGYDLENDLAIRDAYGDWDRRPLGSDSPRMIYVCQARSP